MTDKAESKTKSPSKIAKVDRQKKSLNEKPGTDELFATRMKQIFLMGLSIVGFGIYLIDLLPDQQTHAISQMSFRVAIVLLTMWLALPQLEKLFKESATLLLLGALLIAFAVSRIQLLLLAIVGFCLIYALIKYVIRVVKE